MLLTSYLLAGLAILLAWPIPVALSRARWTARSPFAAMVVWQSIALAGGLSMIGAMLFWGLEPLGGTLLDALDGGIRLISGNPAANSPGIVHIFALSTAALLGFHLILTLIRAAWRITRQRSRHRNILRLLTEESTSNPGTLVLDHETPIAYCLPSFSGSITVLSRGLVQRLSPEELRAVLAHEKAHLEQRHDLLLLAFTSWNDALPWLPTSKHSLAAVQELVEMLADDAALREVTPQVLLRALLTVATGALGESDMSNPAALPSTATGGAPTEELSSYRLRRLLTPQPPLSTALRAMIISAAVLLLALPTTMLIAPGLFA
ncbi:M56 family metallopeptidase [Paeniglutamicibacter gangotriensis]|uniref:M56 family metallopeptidase n=1 Tax=Paeniglutamicibacter gangotriensis TaxID=254787 RepID=A0A5B0ELN8_9MICC|nr:M56 family metallopeptidase [Paeniglutamicibacter gangotriensis]KAA0979723.1 M56 family metallopeptidase [Paeniglutamicibacter gangotriensis]